MGVPRIAVDAHGGDDSPGPEIEASLACARDGLGIRLVGDRERLERALHGEDVPDTLQIVHAPDRIAMDDSPGRAVRRKPNASMPVAFDLCVAGDADAVVSAGNSGAMLACGVFKFRRLKTVDRPAVAATFPREQGHTCLLDSGANVDCRPLHLAQFAVMGSAYARVHLGVERPTVGVLSNGSEDAKGTALTRAAHHALSASPSPDFEYVGYVEANRIFTRAADVIVTDGFTGNVALKAAEGTVLAVGRMLAKALPKADRAWAFRLDPALDEVRRRLDPDEHGGAPLLGVGGIAIICHGASSARAIASGIRVAAGFVDACITTGVSEALDRHRALFDLVRSGDYSTAP